MVRSTGHSVHPWVEVLLLDVRYSLHVPSFGVLGIFCASGFLALVLYGSMTNVREVGG